MATLSDVRRLALALPESSESPSHDGNTSWRVRGKGFAWERPLRTADLTALGDAAPEGEVLALRVADLDAKDALLAEQPDVYFTTPHFDGYPAILVRLAVIAEDELTDRLVEAWAARAPRSQSRIHREFLTRRPLRPQD